MFLFRLQLLSQLLSAVHIVKLSLHHAEKATRPMEVIILKTHVLTTYHWGKMSTGIQLNSY